MSSGSSFGTGPYDVILDIATAIVTGGSVEATLQTIVENVARAMFAEAATLGSYHPERNEFTFEAEWREGGLTAQQRAEIGLVVNLKDKPDLRRALDSRRLMEYHIDDPTLNELYRDYLTRRGLKTTIDCPLIFANQVIGLLGVEESRFVRHYTPSERALFTRLCDLAAIGIHTARQSRKLKQLEDQLSALRRGEAPAGAS